MTRRRLIAAAAVVCIAAELMAGCSPPGSGVPYEAEIQAARAAKDQMMRESGSPMPENVRDKFLPFSYYPPDPSYRVAAQFRPAGPDAPVSEIPTSTGKMRRLQVLGTLAFTLKDRPLELMAFNEDSPEGRGKLFVPFTDLTSGTETYAAGRYLDLNFSASGVYEVDFNLAYHPYCYFNPAYDCPFPPLRNRLKVPIRAGERLPLSQ
jgi:uncharacterized protein (DUF1684 family)